MTKVVELYRHPVKSFTPERLEELRVVEGRVQGDRVLAFRFANKGATDDWVWQTKHNYVVLVNTPAMALLELKFNYESRVLSLNYAGESFVEGSIDSEEDRDDICEAVGEYVSSLEINPLIGHPERVPLKLIGDGQHGLFHDTAAGGITVHSVESLKALEDQAGSEIDGRRFRTNVVIDGADAWEELSWAGRVMIGEVQYKVVKPVTRCLATHANPVNGDRDLQIMDYLVQANSIEAPTFAVRLEPADATLASTISLGDVVVVRN